jgi:hypothetical protein
LPVRPQAAPSPAPSPLGLTESWTLRDNPAHQNWRFSVATCLILLL